MLTSIVAVAACLAACTFLAPQVLRLARTGDTAGLSATMAALGALSCVAWLVYGVAVGAWPLVLTGGLAGAEYIGFCLLLWRARHPLGRAMALTVGAAALLVAAMAIGAQTGAGMWTGLGAALNLAVIAQYGPAVLEAHRAPSISGIALGTWAIVGVNGTLWGLYGYLIGDAALIGYGLALGAATGGVAVAVARDRRPGRRPPATGGTHPDVTGPSAAAIMYHRRDRRLLSLQRSDHSPRKGGDRAQGSPAQEPSEPRTHRPAQASQRRAREVVERPGRSRRGALDDRTVPRR